MKQTTKELRQIALGATRSQIRKLGERPEDVEPQEALKVLSDIALGEPQLLCSVFYNTASDAQIRIFKREWSAMQQRARDDELFLEANR